MTGGTIRYALTDFLRGRTPEAAKPAPATVAGPALVGTATCGGDDRDTASGASADRDEIRIPLLRRRSESRRSRANRDTCGIHKMVVTEEKRFSVPVTREEIVIEHVAIGRDAALTGDDAFVEDTVEVALYEEEVRVSKAPSPGRGGGGGTVAHSVDREGSRCCATRRPRNRGHAQEPWSGRERRGLRLFGSGRPPLGRQTRNRWTCLGVGNTGSSRKWWGPSGWCWAAAAAPCWPRPFPTRHRLRRAWRWPSASRC